MAKWRYTLKIGPDLRDAISNENYEEILNYLEIAWKKINEKFPDEYEEDELIEDLADIDNERENLLNFESYGLDFEEVIENIDYLLNNLYEYCDNTRIWIEI